MANPLVIHDRYEVIRRLAIGGMGEIFLARQRGAGGFNRLAILKTLRPELAEEKEFLEQFLDEVRVAARLNHPNIVAVYEVGLFQGVHFIAMEYIGGIDLAVLLREVGKRGERIPYRVAASIAREAAVGLDAAHRGSDEQGQALGIVHRDVSPQNLMIRPDGVVKVVDFGVAQASNQVHETATDKIKGKIRYMSPEHLAGYELDGRSDQFSLGIVLWELCTGRPLFSDANPLDVFHRILAADIPKPSAYAEDIPAGLEAIISQMLAPHRDDRFSSCGEAAAALREIVDIAPGRAEDEVCEFVQRVAGDFIADRVKDLTPRQVFIQGVGEIACPTCAHRQMMSARFCQQCGASLSEQIRAVVTADHDSVDAQAVDTSADTETFAVRQDNPLELSDAMTLPSAPPVMSGNTEIAVEASDALLFAVEHSGVFHGSRRLLTIVVGELPGLASLVRGVANVPMGAFAVVKMKNLMLRQLETIAREHGGAIVSKSADRLVLAFGVEASEPEDADRAVEFACTMRAMFAQQSQGAQATISPRIGIARGVCMVGGEDQGQLQLAGAALDRAEALSRLAQQTESQILLAPSLARWLSSKHPTKRAQISGEEAYTLRHTDADPREQVLAKAQPRRILIADDADVFRKLIEDQLRPHNYALLHARDGAEAIRIAVEELPDCILLDVQMPVMDGIQVLSYLRQNPDTKGIPIVVVSTAGPAVQKELDRCGGANAYLSKPVKPNLLLKTVRSLLETDSDQD